MSGGSRTSTFAWVHAVNVETTLDPSEMVGGVTDERVGEPRRIRTFNLVIKSHLLYR